VKVVLDTSVLIAGPNVSVPGDLAISAASIAELQFGVLITDDATVRAHRLTRLTRILQVFAPLPFDTRVAASYGELAAATVRAGRQPRRRQLDLVVAATAHAYSAHLATANLADVAHLSDLIDLIEVPTRTEPLT